MKKTLGKEALELEETFWKGLKKALKEKPARTCRK